MYDNAKYYFNRELSWLKFNLRVLQEAIDKKNPLLERLRFLGIGASNLDEFFMIRVAGLRHEAKKGIVKFDSARMDAKRQLKAIDEATRKLVIMQYSYVENLLKELRREGMCIVHMEELLPEELTWLREYFESHIYPVITPLAVDEHRPFPLLANKTMNIAVGLTSKTMGKKEKAILPVPGLLPRCIEIPKEKSRRFVLLEDVIAHFSERFFSAYEVTSTLTFRITRDADLDIEDSEWEDVIREMERSLRQRKKGDVVRLEVQERVDEALLAFLMDGLGVSTQDVYCIDGILDLTGLFDLCDAPEAAHLRYPPFAPIMSPRLRHRAPGTSIFDAIKEEDILLHHPFESFQAVEDFISTAATDPNVLAIKQTLYRVGHDSTMIASLMKAVEQGKQVTVLMEVKARFDEETNIQVAKELEKAGCHVIYGLKGLKTHSKITMVVRRESPGIVRYVHVGTGNYNRKTARVYTDCGLLTCDGSIGEDSTTFFNLISGYSEAPTWNTFLVAPLNLRDAIIEGIDREIAITRNGGKGYIIAKMNSLLDQKMIRKLYEASAAGVEIDLIVRGICTLRPGIPGVSDHIRVRSILGRFLEHHRITYFHNDGDPMVLMGSADWMPRNLNDRVELMIPIRSTSIKKRLIAILKTYLKDNQKAHIMRADGSYRKVVAKENPIQAQESFMDWAEENR